MLAIAKCVRTRKDTSKKPRSLWILRICILVYLHGVFVLFVKTYQIHQDYPIP